MNPAFTNWWLSQHGGPNAYQDSMIGAPEQDFMQQYNVMPREDVERMGKVVVPGTGGMQEAPKMPSPFPIDPHDMPAMLNSMLTPEEEYERYGTMHGIVPDPNSQYDTQDGPHNGPLDMQGNPVNQGTPSAGPLEKGSAAATQAVGERKRGRYEMDEMQQRRALGAAIMQLFAQRPGASEHETGLTRMAYNMSPATQAYLNEAHHFEKLNLAEAKQAEGQGLTGLPQEYASYEVLKRKLGEDHPSVKQAKRALDARLEATEQLTKNRVKYVETADKRASTPLGKLQLEREDIDAGYMPGTNKTVTLDDDQRLALRNQYDLEIQKKISDVDTRKRSLFASNIDKTIKMIDTDALTQYAGLYGEGKKKAEQLKSMTGHESEDYAKYQEALVAADTLAIQVRQFYGESITPSVREALHDITNPASWKNNPKLAKRQFQKLVDILENETSTFKGALQSPKEFQQNKDEEFLGKYSMSDIEATAKRKGMTKEQVMAELEKRG